MRYIVGIDLGTTNCSLAFIDTAQNSLPIQIFAIPQIQAAGKIGTQLNLPSFCYLISDGEWPPGALKLPWKEETTSFVGQFAKTQGAKSPTRLIQSAKSWLCHSSANRKDKILPIEASNISQRLSPVEVSSKYLEHLRDAWNMIMAKGDSSLELEEQEIILTVPASFDEVARRLTIEAAQKAGLRHITLAEEPQAAFYSWISQHEHQWENQFKMGDSILVCDIGGGTTDFSLIEIQQQGEQLSFQRMSVGNHLLLGGDNMDIALTHYLEQRLRKEHEFHLESSQWLQLQAEARNAKEFLLQSHISPQGTYNLNLQGAGSFVVKGSTSLLVQRKEVEDFLLNGFFGSYPLQEAVQLQPSRGLRTLGLPYEDEPSIIKHLAYFLKQSHFLEKNKGIDYILFNGGTLKPKVFQEAIQQALTFWFPQASLKSLETISLDLAVARGAAYYGRARRGTGISIGGGTPRTYYLKIDVKSPLNSIESQALTLLPRGSEENRTFRPPQTFFLRPNIPVAFYLLTSHVRLSDQEGDLVPIDPLEIQPLPPIQTILRFGRKSSQTEEIESTIPVQLMICLTPIGTVELWLESQISDHKWQLEFQIRSAAGQDLIIEKKEQISSDETFEQGYLEEAKRSIQDLFLPNAIAKPSEIMDRLESQLKSPRQTWGPNILRELWNSLLKAASYRKLSKPHEARWWNLAGFFLRPGFGFPLDDFRLKDLWKIILADLKASKSSDILVQMCICCRRIAGGFSKGQQMQLFSGLIHDVFDKKTEKIIIKHKSDLYLYSEKIRLLASLERLDLALKKQLGEALLKRVLSREAKDYEYWALGRIGARHLLHGSLGQALPKDCVSSWVKSLVHQRCRVEEQELMLFLLRQLARKTGERELDLPEPLIKEILNLYPEEHLRECLLETKQLTQSEQALAFGDQLPSGLLLETAP